MSLPWNEIIKKIGKLKILEIGCGKGIYGKLIKEIVNQNIECYTGIDPKKNPLISLAMKILNFIKIIQIIFQNIWKITIY